MSQIFKTLLSVFLISLGAVIIMGIITADTNATNARAYQNSVVQQIECSNMASSVINSCVDTANSETSYNLTVNQITDESGKVVMCEVILDYDYTIPILHVSTQHQIRGYAT